MKLESYSEEHPHFYGAGDVVPPLITAIASRNGGTFVDVGAGDGARLDELFRSGLLKRFDHVVGIDLSPIRVEHLRERLPNVEAHVGDACNIPLAGESADIIYSEQVIEHVADDRAMAAEIARVLKPGAVAVVGSVLRSPGAWWFYKVQGVRRLDPTHLREYESAEAFQSVFLSAGLAVKHVRVSPLGFPLTDLALRLLIRLKLLKPQQSMLAYARFPILRRARSLRLPIPRYSIVHVVLERAVSTS